MITKRLLIFWRSLARSKSGLDADDFDGGQKLAVASCFAVVFTTTELLDDNFLVFELTDDFGFDLGSNDSWLANGGFAIARGNKQNFFENYGRIRLAITKIDNKFIANGHSVLVAAIFKNRVHLYSRIS